LRNWREVRAPTERDEQQDVGGRGLDPPNELVFPMRRVDFALGFKAGG
jgi:hypothetical protein